MVGAFSNRACSSCIKKTIFYPKNAAGLFANKGFIDFDFSAIMTSYCSKSFADDTDKKAIFLKHQDHLLPHYH